MGPDGRLGPIQIQPTIQPALVNGAVGLAIVPQGRLMGALGFTVRDGKITEIEMISEPGRLRDVDLSVPGA